MNKQDFKLAVKAGWIKEAGEPDAGCLNLEQFANLIRADEREACAKLADDESMSRREIAAAIRARGNT